MGALSKLLTLLVLSHVPYAYSDTFDVVDDANGCAHIIHRFNPLFHKSHYRVGIYSSESDEVVYRMYNVTFAQYLTATAGRRFNPPVTFDIVPVGLDSLAHMAEKEEVDFFFSSSAVFRYVKATNPCDMKQPETTLTVGPMILAAVWRRKGRRNHW